MADRLITMTLEVDDDAGAASRLQSCWSSTPSRTSPLSTRCSSCGGVGKTHAKLAEDRKAAAECVFGAHRSRTNWTAPVDPIVIAGR